MTAPNATAGADKGWFGHPKGLGHEIGWTTEVMHKAAPPVTHLVAKFASKP